jgi:hypothetical protein
MISCSWVRMRKQLAHGVDIDRGPQKTGTPGGQAFYFPFKNLLKSTIFIRLCIVEVDLNIGKVM